MSGSKQCCSLPPVQAEYTPKGSYGTLAGLKSYGTGPTNTGKAILIVYDVFGYSPQILQGADILASAGYRVEMPDYLLGSYATADMFDGTDAGNAKRDKYFGGYPGKADSQSSKVAETLEALKKDGYKKVGTAGYCWGWKATVTSSAVNDFDAIAAVHPSFIDESDAERITGTPVLLLPSEGEDKKTNDGVYAALEKKNPGQNKIKWYDDQPHGFAAARGDLSGGKATEAYQDAYAEMIKFFQQYA